MAVPNPPPDVLADGRRASQYTPPQPTSRRGIGDCHGTAAALIVPHPFLGISVSDFRTFKCTTHKFFRECVVSHTLLELLETQRADVVVRSLYKVPGNVERIAEL